MNKISWLDDPVRFASLWGKILLAGFVLFYFIPGIDLWVARQFYLGQGQFRFSTIPQLVFIHNNIEYLIFIGLGGLITCGLLCLGGFRQGTGHVNGSQIRRQWVMALSALIIGPGLVANLIFKELWGRARPIQIVEFGGAAKFTPPLMISDQCSSNCSFIGGDSSLGFWFLIFGFMVTGAWRYRLLFMGILIGLASGIIRIGQGAHFLSDILFSGWIMFGVCFAIAWLFSPPPSIGQKIQQAVMGLAQLLRRFGNELIHPQSGLNFKGLRRKLGNILVLIMLAMIFLDIPILNFVYQLSPNWRGISGEISDAALGKWYLIGLPLISVMILSIALLARIIRQRQFEKRLINWLIIPSMIWFAVVLSGLITNIFKVVLGKYRPNEYFGKMDLTDGNGTVTFITEKARIGLEFFSTLHSQNSFPSGHATTAFAVATCVWLIWPRLGWISLIFGLVMATTRVLAGAHWPSDVIAGAFVGFASAVIIHAMMNRMGWSESKILAGQKFSDLFPSKGKG